MEVSPKTLREVEFREKMRGYHPEDVDHFLEQVAAGLEVMQERLRQAVDRAQRAEAAAAEAGGTDETLRKTLVLAQRTADMAVQEAREQAARVLAGAEQQAQAMLAEAEERGRKALEEAVVESRAELARLDSSRAQSQQHVDTLQRWIDEHTSHLQMSLSEALASLERVGVLWPAPSALPSEAAPSTRAASAPPPPRPDLGTEADDAETWSGGDDELESDEIFPSEGRAAAQSFAPPLQAGVVDVRPGDSTNGPDERAMDDFFDEAAELSEEPRFGGRLRRRR